MADADLTIRMLREIRGDLTEVRDELRSFRAEVNNRLGVVEHTLNGVAGHVFALTRFMKTMDQRVRKLEGRPAR